MESRATAVAPARFGSLHWRPGSKLSAAAAACGFAAALALPFLVSDYHVFQFTLVVIYAIALLGLNLLTGYGGQISLGHGAFFGIGAYTAAILIHKYSAPQLLTLPCAAVVCMVVGFLFGLPALRLEGLYLALATFALGIALPQLLKYKGIEQWTGGVQGISLPKPDAPFGLPLSADHWLYFLSFGVATALFVCTRNLVRGQTGRTIIAIRDCPVAASSAGINNALYKSITFGISAMYTGVAGALSALTVQFVGPDSFSAFLSFSLLVGIVVGGLASISGAVYGAVFIQFIPNVADELSKAAPWAIYGLVLIASVHLMPLGIAGFLARVTRRREKTRITGAVTPPQEEP
jgi:branched-chain amino acid transport system permease protein